MGWNSIVVHGNLGRDPELRYTPNGTPVCQFSLASEDRIRKDGEWQKHTTWFRITVFGRQAETASQYLQRGKPCAVIGRLRVEEWVNREGKTGWTAEVTADHVKFTGTRDDSEDRARAESEREYQRKKSEGGEGGGNDLTDDDVPF
jgi:single-strand DNA-binding protein